MEELDLNNILNPDEINSLFEEDSEAQETSPEAVNEETEKKDAATEAQINPEELFEPESVGSGKEDKQGKEDTVPEGTG